MAYAGQFDNYGDCNQLILHLTGQKVGSTQVFRVTNAYGSELGMSDQSERSLPPVQKEEVVYAQNDGSMILTRDGWKEVKLGRVFKSSDCLPSDGKQRGALLCSQYIAHLGSKGPFCRGMDELLDSFGGNALGPRLVFINDGAEWINNWIRDIFPPGHQYTGLLPRQRAPPRVREDRLRRPTGGQGMGRGAIGQAAGKPGEGSHQGDREGELPGQGRQGSAGFLAGVLP